MKLQINPLFELIAQGEHQHQDFKYCINDSRKIAKSLVAFANSEGGRLLVGVKDNGKIAGVKSDEEYYMVEAAANIYSRPKIDFTVQQWDVDGKTVLEIDVSSSKLRPHYAENDVRNWIAYIRNNDENIQANRVLLKTWRIDKSKNGLIFNYDDSRKKLVQYIELNKEITLSKFTKIAQITRTMAENILAEFLSMECIIINIEQKPVTYSLNNEFNLKEILKN